MTSHSVGQDSSPAINAIEVNSNVSTTNGALKLTFHCLLSSTVCQTEFQLDTAIENRGSTTEPWLWHQINMYERLVVI